MAAGGVVTEDLQARVTFAMRLINQNGTNAFLLETGVVTLNGSLAVAKL